MPRLLAQSSQLLPFVGMMLGSFLTGFLGDRYGRRFTYQANLAIFGLASIASAFAPSMAVLTLLRFIMGVGLGAENVVGYSTMTEFVPPQARGKWLGGMNVIVVSGLPVAALLWNAHHPALRLARHVRARRIGCAGRLVSAQGVAGVAALAGIGRPNPRSGSPAAVHRKRSLATARSSSVCSAAITSSSVD